MAIRLALLLIVYGPLHWAASLFLNDLHDLGGDRGNPRKSGTPMILGLVSARQAGTGAVAAGAAALALAASLSAVVAGLVAGSLALAWAYNAPPARTKNRPGLDVVTNMARIGLLPILAGWALAAPVAGFPWHWLPKGLLVAAAVYIPTMILDHDADRAAGLRTVATVLGVRRAYRIGFACWLAGGILTLESAWRGGTIPHGLLPVLLVLVPFQVVLYHVLIGKARDQVELVRGIFVCSLAFAVTGVLFILVYGGVWAP